MKDPLDALDRDLAGDDRFKGLGSIRIRCVAKYGKCGHEVGDTYLYTSPYKRPGEVCDALLHVLDLYTWRVLLGFPSWESDDDRVYRIHCPSKNGTLWEMRLESGEGLPRQVVSVEAECARSES